MNNEAAQQSAQRKLANIKAPWVMGVLGLSIIIGAFVISIVNATIDTPNSFISLTLQPFIFVGVGLLLYHVGQHVHAMNQNAILMLANMSSSSHDPPER
jgi:carbon starvation protein CstA